MGVLGLEELPPWEQALLAAVYLWQVDLDDLALEAALAARLSKVLAGIVELPNIWAKAVCEDLMVSASVVDCES